METYVIERLANDVFSLHAIRMLAGQLHKQYVKELRETTGENEYLESEIKTVEK